MLMGCCAYATPKANAIVTTVNTEKRFMEYPPRTQYEVAIIYLHTSPCHAGFLRQPILASRENMRSARRAQLHLHQTKPRMPPCAANSGAAAPLKGERQPGPARLPGPAGSTGFADHLFRLYPLIELLGGQVPKCDRRFLEREAVLVRVFGDLRRLVVADVRVQRRYQHQRFAHELLDALPIGLYANRALIVEIDAAVGKQARAMQEIANHQRTEHIELEVARRAAQVDRNVVAEHLAAQHGQRLRLRRIDLARHDGAAWLVLRNAEFANAAARAGSQPANVVGDFHQGGGEC